MDSYAYKAKLEDDARDALTKAGVRWTEHNMGMHFKLPDYGIDYWPRTRKWMHRGQVQTGPLQKFVSYVRKLEPEAPRPKVKKRTPEEQREVTRRIYGGRCKPVKTPCTDHSLPVFDGKGLPWD